MDQTADASFAAIRALSKLGIAMAATISTGIAAIPRYPMISPPSAIPPPLRRPWLFRISEREMCPRMIAAIAEGMRKEKKPRIKLAMAVDCQSIQIGRASCREREEMEADASD